jgi:clan AA aspartic protease
MIQGLVTGLQARINVPFRVAGQPDPQIECVVDTGFAGALVLPPAAIAALGLPYRTHVTAKLADNTRRRAAVHVATILWEGEERDVAVLALDGRPLVGTALLAGYHLDVDFADGGVVTIERL